MSHVEIRWAAKDGLPLFSQAWEVNDPRAVVCLVHGLGEHSSRYAHLAACLNQANLSVLTFDLRGHGQSGGPRGHVDNFQEFMDDIDLLLQQARSRYPNKPLFMYGHSLGGLLTLSFVLHRKPDLLGVVVTAPGLRTALEKQTVKIRIAQIGGQFLPTLALPTGLDARMLSRDMQVVSAYAQDPLVHDRATLRMARETLASIPEIFALAPELHVPLLLMHGTGDQIAFSTGSQEIASLAPGQCTLRLWDGLYHEIHNEPEQDQVFSFLLDWLNQRLAG